MKKSKTGLKMEKSKNLKGHNRVIYAEFDKHLAMEMAHKYDKLLESVGNL